jgi:hypothetical protein
MVITFLKKLLWWISAVGLRVFQNLRTKVGTFLKSSPDDRAATIAYFFFYKIHQPFFVGFLISIIYLNGDFSAFNPTKFLISFLNAFLLTKIITYICKAAIETHTIYFLDDPKTSFICFVRMKNWTEVEFFIEEGIIQIENVYQCQLENFNFKNVKLTDEQLDRCKSSLTTHLQYKKDIGDELKIKNRNKSLDNWYQRLWKNNSKTQEKKSLNSF